MKLALHFCSSLAALIFVTAPASAQNDLGFETESEQWFEFSVAGGWGIYQSAANQINLNGGSPFLFDDGAGNGGTLKMEFGWGTAENFAWGLGLWYARGTDDAVSPEVTDPLYEPAPSDDFLYYRSVTHSLIAPYISAKYFFHNSGHSRYFLCGGTMLGVGRATFDFWTEDLASGELRGDRDIGDTKMGLFASVGLRRLLSSAVSFGAEVGYRYLDEMELGQRNDAIQMPPLGPTALAVSNILDVNYSGPFAMVSVILKP